MWKELGECSFPKLKKLTAKVVSSASCYLFIIKYICLSQALFRVLNLRNYNGHIHFIPAPGFEAHGDPVIHVDDCKCDILLSKWGKGGNYSTEQCKYMGPEVAMERMEWRSIDGPFISVLVHNVPFSGEDYMPAPKAEVVSYYSNINICLRFLVSVIRKCRFPVFA